MDCCRLVSSLSDYVALQTFYCTFIRWVGVATGSVDAIPGVRPSKFFSTIEMALLSSRESVSIHSISSRRKRNAVRRLPEFISCGII